MNDPEYARLYEEAEAEQRLGQLVYDRRVVLGLSQAELAKSLLGFLPHQAG
ncbi:hypothetical protein [Nonomuraea sp. NPDC049129]|uniref:hypothetical protein n=1 Tax=Nonomuraea sp. NPDC049129 TaxID=3155272 RepID=UPI0033E27C94